MSTLALPKLSGSIGVDTASLKTSFTAAVSEARSFKANFEQSLQGMKIPPINASVAIAGVRAQIEQAKAAAAMVRGSATIPFADEPGIGFRKDSTIARQELKASISFDDAKIRQNVADAIRVARGELASKNLAMQIHFNPNLEAVERFKATAATGASAQASAFSQVAKAQDSIMNAAFRITAVVHGVKAAIDLAGVGTTWWKAQQDAVNGAVEKATIGYDKAITKLREINVLGAPVGDWLAGAGDFMSGGAVSGIQSSAADAKSNDAHSADMVAKHKAATLAMKQQSDLARAAAIGGDELEYTAARVARDNNVAGIKEQLALKKVGAEQAKEAINAENAKFNAVFDQQANKRMQAGKDALLAQQKAAEEARAAAQKPFDDVSKQIATTGMSEEDRAVFDFKADKTHTADAIARYGAMVGKLKEVKAQQAMADDAKAWKENLNGPVEKYDEIIGKLKEWRTLNAKDATKGITQDEFKKGVQGAKEQLAGNLPNEKTETRFASFMKAGGADQLRLQFQNARDRDDKQLAEKHFNVAQRQEDLLKSINDRLDMKVG